MRTHFDVYTNPPKHWNDGLEWTKDTKPTLRHFQAILLACCERKWLTRINSLPSSVVEQMLHYQPKTFENLFSMVRSCLDFKIINRWPLGDFASGGREYLCFDTKDMYWHYPEYEDILLDYGSSRAIASGQLRYVNGRAFEKFYIENYPKSTRVSFSQRKLFDKFMFINNNDVMDFLISVKKIVNGAHCVILCPKIRKGTDAFTTRTHTFVDYDTYRDNITGKIKGFQTNQVEYSSVFPPRDLPNFDYWGTCYEGHYYCNKIYDGTELEYNYWEYDFFPITAPYRIANHSSTAFQVKGHWWEHAESAIFNNYEIVDYELVDTTTNFHPFGKFTHKGWNDFGVLQPNEELEIFDPKDSYQQPTEKPYWYDWDTTPRSVGFSMGMDAMLLDFGVEGGFNFFEKTE